MSAKHTPGPWEFKHRAGSDDMYRTEVFSATHGGIATCAWTPKNCGNGVTATYREANARLIAAAPDLLTALQEAVRSEIKGRALLAKCEAAIARATGSAQ